MRTELASEIACPNYVMRFPMDARYIASIVVTVCSVTADIYASSTCLEEIRGEFSAGLRTAFGEPPVTEPEELPFRIRLGPHATNCFAEDYPPVHALGSDLAMWNFSEAITRIKLPLIRDRSGEWVEASGIDVIVDSAHDVITMTARIDEPDHPSGLPIGSSLAFDFHFRMGDLTQAGVKEFFEAPWNVHRRSSQLIVTALPDEDPVFTNDLSHLVAMPPGDFNGNGRIDAIDIDILTHDIIAGINIAYVDINGDGLANQVDRAVWVHKFACTFFGDANLDGEFNRSDLVVAFELSEYEDAVPFNSLWETGDWNGDGDFDSGDLVLAFQDGGYEQGPRTAMHSVPETSCFGWLTAMALALSLNRRE